MRHRGRRGTYVAGIDRTSLLSHSWLAGTQGFGRGDFHEERGEALVGGPRKLIGHSAHGAAVWGHSVGGAGATLALVGEGVVDEVHGHAAREGVAAAPHGLVAEQRL